MKFVFRGSEENYEFMVDDKPTISKSSRKFEAETVDEIVENFYMFLRGMGFYVEIPERSNDFQDFVDEFLPKYETIDENEDEVDEYLADVEEAEGGGWLDEDTIDDLKEEILRYPSLTPCEQEGLLVSCVAEGLCEEPTVESLVSSLGVFRDSVVETLSSLLDEKIYVDKCLTALRGTNTPQCCGGNCHVETTPETKEDPQ